MTRLEDIPQPTRDAAIADACPGFETRPFVVGSPLARRRVAIVSSAALIRRGDKPFPFGSAERRFSPGRPGFPCPGVEIGGSRRGDPTVTLGRMRRFRPSNPATATWGRKRASAGCTVPTVPQQRGPCYENERFSDNFRTGAGAQVGFRSERPGPNRDTGDEFEVCMRKWFLLLWSQGDAHGQHRMETASHTNVAREIRHG